MAPEAPLDALAARVRSVAEGLPDRERRALILREHQGASYAEIAEAVSIRETDVAAILVSARLWIRGGVRQKDLPPLAGEDCARARELMTTVQDRERLGPQERSWLPTHV